MIAGTHNHNAIFLYSTIIMSTQLSSSIKTNFPIRRNTHIQTNSDQVLISIKQGEECSNT